MAKCRWCGYDPITKEWPTGADKGRYPAGYLTCPKRADHRPRVDPGDYAYCDRDHPGGDAEARDWHERYHR